MRPKLIPATGVAWVAITLVLLGCGAFCAPAADLKLQAFLLWGTDDSKPPEGKIYKPVEPDILKKLKDLPLLKQSRLSVMPLAESAFERLLELGLTAAL